MYQAGEILKVPVIMVQNGEEASKGYAMGEVLGASETVDGATQLRVDLGDGRFTIANIKNSDLDELN